MRRREIESSLESLVTPEVIEEHRRQPTGHHSPALTEILVYFRQAPTDGKFAALATHPGRQWQVIRLSGLQRVPHDTSDPARFDSEDAVSHEIFLRRLDELGLRGPVPNG